jgi:hypothetical protein
MDWHPPLGVSGHSEGHVRTFELEPNCLIMLRQCTMLSSLSNNPHLCNGMHHPRMQHSGQRTYEQVDAQRAGDAQRLQHQVRGQQQAGHLRAVVGPVQLQRVPHLAAGKQRKLAQRAVCRSVLRRASEHADRGRCVRCSGTAPQLEAPGGSLA